MKNKILDNLPIIFVALTFIFGLTLSFNHAKADWQAALSVGCGFIRVKSAVCPEQFNGYNGAEIDNYENYDAVSALVKCEIYGKSME